MRTESNAKKIIIKPKCILYGIHPFVLLLYKPHLFGLTKHKFYFNSFNYPYMCAACFGLYLGVSQTCQYKNRTNKNTLKIQGTP